MRQTFFWAMLQKEAGQEYSSAHCFAIVIALKPQKNLRALGSINEFASCYLPAIYFLMGFDYAG